MVPGERVVEGGDGLAELVSASRSEQAERRVDSSNRKVGRSEDHHRPVHPNPPTPYLLQLKWTPPWNQLASTPPHLELPALPVPFLLLVPPLPSTRFLRLHTAPKGDASSPVSFDRATGRLEAFTTFCLAVLTLFFSH